MDRLIRFDTVVSNDDTISVGWQDIEEICCFGLGIYCYYWGIAVDQQDQGLGPERGFSVGT